MSNFEFLAWAALTLAACALMPWLVGRVMPKLFPPCSEPPAE